MSDPVKEVAVELKLVVGSASYWNSWDLEPRAGIETYLYSAVWRLEGDSPVNLFWLAC